MAVDTTPVNCKFTVYIYCHALSTIHSLMMMLLISLAAKELEGE